MRSSECRNCSRRFAVSLTRGFAATSGRADSCYCGSASVDLLKQSGELLAGRIAYVEFEQFSVLGVNDDGREKLWIRGGFPDSFLAQSGRSSVVWPDECETQSYLQRDIPQTYGPRCASGNVAPLLDDASSCAGRHAQRDSARALSRYRMARQSPAIST